MTNYPPPIAFFSLLPSLNTPPTSNLRLLICPLFMRPSGPSFLFYATLHIVRSLPAHPNRLQVCALIAFHPLRASACTPVAIRLRPDTTRTRTPQCEFSLAHPRLSAGQISRFRPRSYFNHYPSTSGTTTVSHLPLDHPAIASTRRSRASKRDTRTSPSSSFLPFFALLLLT